MPAQKGSDWLAESEVYPMRELAVFYCPCCGHYAYYQTSQHPVCPKCRENQPPMCMLRMYYAEFMRLSSEERDNYISMEMLKRNPSIISRIAASGRLFNSRQTIARLCTVIMDLDAENKRLSDTVSWMHDTIWHMMREQRRACREPEAAATAAERGENEGKKEPPGEADMPER